MEGIRGVTPVAALLAFAVVYFGVMNDAGLFEPVVRALVRVAGGDPVRIAVGTAVLASVAHLDGAGASTFMVTVPGDAAAVSACGDEPVDADVHRRARGGDDEHAAVGGPDDASGRGAAREHVRAVRAEPDRDGHRRGLRDPSTPAASSGRRRAGRRGAGIRGPTGQGQPGSPGQSAVTPPVTPRSDAPAGSSTRH